MSQDFLTLNDVDTLVNLLLRSQQVRSREALCIKIGIDPKRLSFIRDSSDVDFATQLIYYLDQIGDKEALCKLCCEELFPIFQKGKYAPLLNNITLQLNCDRYLLNKSPNHQILEHLNSFQSTSSDSSTIKVFNLIAKNKLITTGIIILIFLSGYTFSKQANAPINNGNPIEQPVPNNPTPIEQSESTTLDYSRLEKLLSEQDWKGADQETTNLIFSLSKGKNNIRTDDIENLSCQVIDKIDQLWRNASQNHFGYSIQNEIWQQQRQQNFFENAVGWSVNGQFIENYPELIKFSLSAPKGHLPTGITLVDRGNTRSMGEIERRFFNHITSCRP